MILVVSTNGHPMFYGPFDQPPHVMPDTAPSLDVSNYRFYMFSLAFSESDEFAKLLPPLQDFCKR